jgi:hypothetical protein
MMRTFWQFKKQPSYVPLEGGSTDGHDVEAEAAEDELQSRLAKTCTHGRSTSHTAPSYSCTLSSS